MPLRAEPAAAPAPGRATHKEMADAIRFLAMDAVEAANSGHPGMPMGMADIATVLFTRFLKFDPSRPEWPDRDRFVLSNGHGSMLLYALLYLTGYADMTLEELKRFRQMGAKTAGHPEYGHAAGIETTTGPLGQGIANAVGMALAEAMQAARYGEAAVDHYTYVFAGDGCLMEGISHEAASLAGHLKLRKLIVLFDDNGISIDGKTDLSVSEDTPARFRAYGWAAEEVDGHDAEALARAIEAARKSERPTLICCKTTIAYGAPTKAGTSASHGSALGKEEIAGTRQKLGWPHAPFEVPEPILSAWREAGAKGESEYRAWEKRLHTLPEAKRAAFERVTSGELPENFAEAVMALKRKWAAEKPNIATRAASGQVLEAWQDVVPELIGGSADLTGSNLTKTKTMQPVSGKDYGGRYLYFGVREHAMAAAMNGIALHGGFIPYGGTFLVFTDYCRPSIRLSALMGVRAVYVMTHDSIGLGEDGPTHQPVEHLPALRAIPNLLVFRPADAVETAECWALALATKHAPSLLSLTRQNVPALRLEAEAENRCARGGYVLAEEKGAKVTLIATGSEVSLAMEARARLKEKGIAARVVSLPCFALFDAQPEGYRKAVLGEGVRVGIEAALGMGWEKYLGESGVFVGMKGFGASAPAGELYRHFGITAEAVVEKVMERV